MSRRRKGAAPVAAPAKLWSLSQYQAEIIRDALRAVDAGKPGLYWGWTVSGFGELVDGGCATTVEIKRWTDTTRSASDPTPIGYLTDHYIVPTAYGLELAGVKFGPVCVYAGSCRDCGAPRPCPHPNCDDNPYER